jgi:hypothetical protein
MKLGKQSKNGEKLKGTGEVASYLSMLISTKANIMRL